MHDAAYNTLLNKTRKQLHERISDVIKAQFPSTAGAEPEVLAYHCTTAGLAERATRYWAQAGERAMERPGDVDVVAPLRNGLETLSQLPESAERDAREAELHGGLFRSPTITDGWGSADAPVSLTRMRDIAVRLGDTDTMLTVLVGDRIQHWVSTEYHEALGVSAQAAQLASQLDDANRHALGPMMSMWPRVALGEVGGLDVEIAAILDA